MGLKQAPDASQVFGILGTQVYSCPGTQLGGTEVRDSGEAKGSVGLVFHINSIFVMNVILYLE